MNYFTPSLMLLVATHGVLFGGYMFYTWIPIAADLNFPVVTGTITERTPIKQSGIPSVDFTIEILDPPAVVHAYAQRYLLHKVPDEVSFRYSGEPSREVFLMEHEENPLLIALVCFAVSALFFFPVIREIGVPTIRTTQKMARTRSAAATMCIVAAIYGICFGLLMIPTGLFVGPHILLAAGIHIGVGTVFWFAATGLRQERPLARMTTVACAGICMTLGILAVYQAFIAGENGSVLFWIPFSLYFSCLAILSFRVGSVEPTE